MCFNKLTYLIAIRDKRCRNFVGLLFRCSIIASEWMSYHITYGSIVELYGVKVHREVD